jgi:hypothetical protein
MGVAVLNKVGVATRGSAVRVGSAVNVGDGGIEVIVGDFEVEVDEGVGGLSGR